IVTVEGGRIELVSRLGNDATSRFPELHALGEQLAGTDAVLDGEIVMLDDRGRPSFERLQPRMHVASPSTARRLAAEAPPVLMLSDLRCVAGHPLCGLPYRERRRALARLGLAGPTWQTPPSTSGNGARVLEAAERLGLEGVVAKRLDSPYLPGRRSDAWRKVK